MLVNFVDSFSLDSAFSHFVDLFIVSILTVVMNRLLADFFLILNFLICIHVQVLTRTLVPLSVTCLNRGFDLI